jgi:hypothetical protein
MALTMKEGPMRNIILILCLLGVACLATPSSAQIHCTDPDLVALVFENGDINLDLGAPGLVQADLYLVNPSVSCACLQGWELKLEFPSHWLWIGATFQGLNIATDPGEFIVGSGTVLNADPNNMIHLAEVSFFATTTAQADFFLAPPSVPDIPGHMAYVDGDDFTIILPMEPISGDYGLPVARANGPDLNWCSTEYDFTVGIAARGDTDNLAGVSASATDGYDPGLDLPEDLTGSHVYFPHPGWPAGDRYKHDIKAVYDPLAQIGQWSFVVDVDNSSSYSTTVDVDFSPSFGAGDGIGLQLYDHTAGVQTGLFPALRYSYTIPSDTHELRSFDLLVGTEPVLYDLSVGIEALIGGLSDSGNLAATLDGATDGYDPGLDIPNPPPPPTNYVTAYFPHPGWPLGERYMVDVRAPFDPLTGMKTWNFTVDTDQSGTLTLDFAPSFNDSAYGLRLRDLQTGQLHDLFPALSYSYSAAGPRDFELIIGREVSAGFTLLVDASVAGLADLDNLAATQPGATDGYDAGLDLPDPPPPPTNFLSAYFLHPDWPLGYRYQTDVRAIYDPLTEMKTWPLRVETDQSGTVNLDFEPSFGQYGGYLLRLRDNDTGVIHNLWPSLHYSYLQGGTGSRDFDILIGAETGPPPLFPPERMVPAGWSMLGTPLLPPPGMNSLADVILDDATGLAYLYRFLGNQGYAMLAPPDTAQQGVGMWIATDQAFSWTMDGTPDLDGSEIPLRDGWSLVGYPLWFPGDLDYIRVNHAGMMYDWWDAVAGGLVSSSVYGYVNPLDSYQMVSGMETWHGYWVAAMTSGVSLQFDWHNFTGQRIMAGPPDDGRFSPEDMWRVAVDLQDASGRRTAAVFGVHPLATGGFDPLYDAPEPPQSPGGPGPRLVFDHPEWELKLGDGFLCDIVKPSDAVSHVWPARIVLPEPGSVTLRWNSSEWPADRDFQLYLPSQNRVVVLSMRDQDQVVLQVGQEPLAVHFRTPDFLTGVGDGGIPTAYRLSIQPNPFNPMAEISFDLPATAAAEVRIYDVRGRLIQRLEAGRLQAGTHRVVWRGIDESGQSVGSGVFFAVLYADGQRVGPITKMSLVR